MASLQREAVAVAANAAAASSAAQLRVRVRWHDGAPAAGVALLCVAHWAQRTIGDATGNGVSVYKDWGFKPVVLRLEGLLPSAVEQRFVVPQSRWPSVHVHLRCVDAVGAPIEGAGIDLWQGESPILTDANLLRATGPGAFDLGPLPPGDYAIVPSHRDYAFERIAVELQAGEGTRELGDRVGRAN